MTSCKMNRILLMGTIENGYEKSLFIYSVEKMEFTVNGYIYTLHH